VVVPGTLHLAFVRSPWAHAEVLSVDADAARRAPGVVAVVTAADLAGLQPLRGQPHIPDLETEFVDTPHPLLAVDRVRYAGQSVAAVVAESRELAEDATELVAVEYEPLEAVVDARTAPPENVLFRSAESAGDVEGAFAAADATVSASLHVPRLVAAPIEPRGLLAQYDPDDDLLTITFSTQGPHGPRRVLSQSLGRDPERIRVVVPAVGGAFGSKSAIPPEGVVCAWLAIELGGRPVKWIEDRLENFLAAYQGRGMDVDAELALRADGRILGLRARVVGDVGAYLYPQGAMLFQRSARMFTGAYDVAAAAVEVVGAATNKPPNGPYRGAGRPEAALVAERMIDLAAHELGLDPIEIRRRNLVRRDAFPYRNALGMTYDSGDYERCLDEAIALLPLDDWKARRDASPDERPVGIGVATIIELTGGASEAAAVEVDENGGVVVRTSATAHGQGHDITFAQIAAEELGVPLEQIEVIYGDSSLVPAGIGTFGSRSVSQAGSALVEALRKLPRDARPARAEATWESPPLFSSGTWLAVVEVERATGRLHVLRVVAVDDAGRIVNPLLAEGQVVGGALQGLGQCLTEEVVHTEDGQPLTITFGDYTLLTAAELPDLETGFVETPSPWNPLGSKGVGESGAIGLPPAIAGAVVDALSRFGVRHVDFPFTPEKLWRLMNP
jgi:carbon-monoxide dehydrogenase large subunit